MHQRILLILFICIISSFTTNASLSVPSEHLYHAFSDETYFLNWTADGQLKTIAAPCRGYIRNHKWNDAGQLVAVVDNNHCGFYAYDGNGERVYKLMGASLVRQINGGTLISASHFDDAVMYVNPYLVLTSRGFSKHYYYENKRLASRKVFDVTAFTKSVFDVSATAQERRSNTQSYMNALLTEREYHTFDIDETYYSPDGAAYDQLQWECLDDESLTIQNFYACDSNLIYQSFNSKNGFGVLQGLFYYHGDHLCSASWITDASGMPIQFIHYQPYGELYINYKTTAYDERFKFTGKERDAETDYDYFGARYYASICPSFISVDPLADKYPGLNPYAYCAWNPIKYVDPDGRKIVIGSWFGRILAKIGFNNFESKVMLQLGKLKDMDSELNKMIISLEKSNITFYIEYENNKNNYYNNLTNTIKYDPDDNIRKDGQIRPPEAALAHELGHAENDKNGDTVKYDRAIANGEKGTKKEQATEQSKRDLNEINSIYYENIVREKEGYPLRGYNYSAGD